MSLGIDGKKLEPESNVLLASIENMQYAVTLDVMHQVNNDRSRDCTIPSTPVLNTQHSILRQQPYPAGGPDPHVYSGPQYASAPAHAVPPYSAGWNPTMPESMPMQMHNYPYAPATSMPALSHGMISPHSQNGLPHSSTMPPYHHLNRTIHLV